MKRCLGRVVCAIGILALARSTWAWNDVGHKTVAMIAWRELKPQAQKQIWEILQKHPQFELRFKQGAATAPADGAVTPAATEAAASVGDDEYAFLIGSAWPDMVRSRSPRDTPFHHAVWHYVDFPFVIGPLPAGRTAEEPVIHWTVGTDPANALQALELCDAQLKNAATAMEQKAIAVCWVEHVIGDIHQPLHAVSLFNAQLPTGDKGGNAIRVSGAPVMNLHAYWDDLMGRDGSPGAVTKIVDSVMAEHPRGEFGEELKNPKFEEWAMESFKLAKETVYLQGHILDTATTVPETEPATAPATQPAAAVERGPRWAYSYHITPEYDRDAHALARKRVAVGGYRLADYLNGILAK